MTIKQPDSQQIPALRALWKQAFGDSEAFLDAFFTLAFSEERCRCLTVNGQVAAALYWFDCSYEGRKAAYLYAVATDIRFQNQGLCRSLMADTHAHLRSRGYDSAMLVPGSESLFGFYEKLGYRTAAHVREFTCAAGCDPIPLRKVGAAEYAALRRKLLPPGGVVQEGTVPTFLEAVTGLYAGENILLTAVIEKGELFCGELLGPADAAAGILAALGAKRGRFRMPGGETPFAMYLPLSENAAPPDYFGLALD